MQLVKLVKIDLFEDVCNEVVNVCCIIVYIVCKCQFGFFVKVMCCYDDDVFVVVCVVFGVNCEKQCQEMVVMYCMEVLCDCLIVDEIFDDVLVEFIVCQSDFDCQYLCLLICQVCIEKVMLNKLLCVYWEIFQLLKELEFGVEDEFEYDWDEFEQDVVD